MIDYNMIKGKKGISPVVATVLLIVVVLVLATAIFIWATSFTEGGVEKFGKNIDQACGEVDLSASYDKDDSSFLIVNEEDISVVDIQVKFSDGDTIICGDSEGLPPGRASDFWSCVEGYIDDSGEPIAVYPVLRGEGDSGVEDYVCDDEFYVDR